jgi:hypothetical protein
MTREDAAWVRGLAMALRRSSACRSAPCAAVNGRNDKRCMLAFKRVVADLTGKKMHVGINEGFVLTCIFFFLPLSLVRIVFRERCG